MPLNKRDPTTMMHRQVKKALLCLCVLFNCSALFAGEFPHSWSQPVIINKQKLALAEGPVWNGENNFYFTEINASKIYRLNLHELKIQLLHENMNYTNGLALDSRGRLWAAMQNEGQIIKFNSEKKDWEVHAGEYQGKRFNHPNDLVVDRQGGVYFTDPAWNTRHRHQPLNGIYYADKNKNVHLLIDDMDKPNGILLSKKADYLYVVDMGTRAFRRYPVLAPGQLGQKETFSEFKKLSQNLTGPDGMAEDQHGNIYVAVDREIQIFNPKGKFLAHIPLPEQVTNLAFAGENIIFVTALENIYRIELEF